jgi:hypothetical protein
VIKIPKVHFGNSVKHLVWLINSIRSTDTALDFLYNSNDMADSNMLRHREEIAEKKFDFVSQKGGLVNKALE